MAIVMVGGALVAALTFCAFIADAGVAAALRMRAQIAADSAALAAVAESGPSGGGSPHSQARAFAEANGARVLECWCEPGATAMQVEVAVGDVVATARAVFDPDLLVPEVVELDVAGLHPRLAAAAERLVAAARGAVRVVSGYRSSAEQSRLWDAAVAHHGTPERADDWVAPPGASMHERGLAVDLGGDLDLAARLVATLGLPLHRPLDHEPWHFELTGSRREH